MIDIIWVAARYGGEWPDAIGPWSNISVDPCGFIAAASSGGNVRRPCPQGQCRAVRFSGRTLAGWHHRWTMKQSSSSLHL